MGRRRQGQPWPTTLSPSAWRQQGWDEVRTPFGIRIVPRGEGWREAAKWALFRGAVWWGGLSLLAIMAVWVHGCALHPH